MKKNTVEQTGLLFELRPTDYILGSTSPLKGEDLNVSADWIAKRPDEEQQFAATFDTMSCATFSATNVLETLFNFFLSQNVFSDNQLKWLRESGYITNEKFNFSDRFSAISNGTMPNGQYLQNVWDDFRKTGLIPEQDLTFGGTTQQEYLDKSKITQAMKDKAHQFLERIIASDEPSVFKLNYEWVPISSTSIELSAALKQAPVQVVVTKENPGHAIMLLRIDTEFDTYSPFLRPRSRTIGYALKPIIKIKKEVPVKECYKPSSFKLEELVPKDIVAKFGEKAWELLDERMLRNLQFFRDTFGPIIVNTTFSQYRGFDPSVFRKEGTSQHNHGRGVDCTFRKYTTAQVIEWLKVPENAAKLPCKDIWVELGVPHFHFDVRHSDKSGVYLFYP